MTLIPAFRDWRKDRFVRRKAATIAKLPTFEAARSLLGSPDEMVEGSTGRKLCVWRQPERSGAFVITLVIDDSGVVTETSTKYR